MTNLKNTVRLDYSDKDSIFENIDTHLGYRSVYYDEDTATSNGEHSIGIVHLLGYSKKTGERTAFEIVNFPLSLYERSDNPNCDLKDAYGKTLAKHEFNSLAERKKYIRTVKKSENYPSHQIVCCDTPEIQFMKEVFGNEALSPDFNKGELKTFYFDIETEISGAFMPPYKAENRINMITVFNPSEKTFYTWTLNPVKILDDTEDGFKHIAYDFNDNETALLEHFLRFWENDYPDVVCGWNSFEFDMPYIIRRCEIVLGSTMTKRFSPFNIYSIKHERSDEVDENGKKIENEEITNVKVVGISQLDELFLYRNKFKVKEALDGGYGLSNVGKAEGLGGKVTYETTLLDLYMTNWQKFYEYNVRDVDLLYAIEKKCKLIPLARTLTSFGFCDYEDIYQSTSYLINTLSLYTLKNREKMIFNTYPNRFYEKRPYEGAYVFEPIPSRYSGGIACVDFNSLYPSCMRALNLSPETYIGRLDWPDGEVQWDTWQKIGGIDGLSDTRKYTLILDRNDVKPPYETIEVTKAQIKLLLDTKCLICGPNLTFFIKHEIKRGVIADWCSDFFAWRKSVKKEMGKFHKEAEHETDPDKKFDLEAKHENAKNLQQAIKIMLNSIYGQTGLSSSPIYNPSLAQSITRLGKFCNINGSKFYRKWLEDNYGIDDSYVVQCSGDTDSVKFSTELDVIYLV